MRILRVLSALSWVLVPFAAISANAEAKTKIGFILATTQEERYQKDIRYFQEEADRLGFEALVVSAENNEQTQAAKVENLLSRGVKALVIQPVNSAAAGNLVRLAHQEKVPVVAYDRLIENAPTDFYVTMDSFAVGTLQAEAAVKATQGKGNYVILMGEAGHSVANEITRGVESILAKHPGIKVVVKKNHADWSPSLAMATVENALTQNHNHIDAILANNSGMAHGAVQALSAQKLTGKVFVAGADADLSAIKDIVAGRQQFEVLKDIAPLAKTAARVALELSQNQKPVATQSTKTKGFAIPTLATPVHAVRKDNLEQTVFATGFHAKAAVYGNDKKTL